MYIAPTLSESYCSNPLVDTKSVTITPICDEAVLDTHLPLQAGTYPSQLGTAKKSKHEQQQERYFNPIP